MKKERRRGNGRRKTKHHIVPRSRGGGNGDNILKFPERAHEAYHTLFGNLTPYEAIRFINIVFNGKEIKPPKKKWSFKELYQLQLLIQIKKSREEIIEEFL